MCGFIMFLESLTQIGPPNALFEKPMRWVLNADFDCVTATQTIPTTTHGKVVPTNGREGIIVLDRTSHCCIMVQVFMLDG